MGRPAKAADTRSGHVTKEELAERKQIETELRGKSDKLIPPDWLNDGQREVFNFVIAEMQAIEVLGNLDVYALTHFAVAAERVTAIEKIMNERFAEASDAEMKDIVFARNSYVKDFWKGVSEFSLSPQARAKIGTIARAKEKEAEDPLRKVLAGGR